jgi:hypothetical protein
LTPKTGAETNVLATVHSDVVGEQRYAVALALASSKGSAGSVRTKTKTVQALASSGYSCRKQSRKVPELTLVDGAINKGLTELYGPSPIRLTQYHGWQ